MAGGGCQRLAVCVLFRWHVYATGRRGKGRLQGMKGCDGVHVTHADRIRTEPDSQPHVKYIPPSSSWRATTARARGRYTLENLYKDLVTASHHRIKAWMFHSDHEKHEQTCRPLVTWQTAENVHRVSSCL